MSINYLKPKYYNLVLIPFSVILIFGLIVLIADIDSIPWIVMFLSILVGAFGTLFGLVMMLYWFTIIYEAVFEVLGINAIIGNKNIYLSFNEIDELDYIKPTLSNYFTSHYGSRYPGRLSVTMKQKNGKRGKVYLIKLKFKDYNNLPLKYKEKINHPIF